MNKLMNGQINEHLAHVQFSCYQREQTDLTVECFALESLVTLNVTLLQNPTFATIFVWGYFFSARSPLFNCKCYCCEMELSVSNNSSVMKTTATQKVLIFCSIAP